MFVLENGLMSLRIERVLTYDVRFPTSASGAGSDAMNPDPDYSAAYVVLETNDPAGPSGHGLTFTLGRGNEICIAAIEALSHHVLGVPVDELTADLGGLSRRLVTDSQLRWLGPEKGVIHLATAALINAVWDLYAKLEGKPLWQLLSDLSPDEIIACVDFRYIDDALSPAEAREILVRNEATRAERERAVSANGFPAYTTSAGWIGYSDETLPQRVDGGPGGRVHPPQAEGRRQPRHRSPPRPDRAGRDGPGAPPLTRREPGLECRRGHPPHPGARPVRPVVDRGADEPGRCARARTHPAARSRRFASRPESTSRIA